MTSTALPAVEPVRNYKTKALFAFCLALSVAAFSGGLNELIYRWQNQEEYSHGFLIPIVTAWMLWTRREALIASIGRPSWGGGIAIFLAGTMLIVGELSAFFLLSQVGFVLCLMGLVLGFGGWSLLRVAFVPLAFLLFAIPTPYFVDSELSYRLQLLSSQLGVHLIRAFDIPVYLSGNIIDLGSYKLQVAEACSGLRYLYPLLSFGFLAAYLYKAPLWQRVLVFLSAVPITIVMNSIRIGMIGVLVNYWGISQAEGALHFFEGWIIFLACAGILGLEIWLLALVSRKRFGEMVGVPAVRASPTFASDRAVARSALPIVLCIGALVAFAGAEYFVSGRVEITPNRERFSAFPTTVEGWKGRPQLLEADIEHALGVDDYIMSDYTKPGTGIVNFYVAYYASQRKGSSPHSPIVCIPGGGWQINDFSREIFQSQKLKQSLPFNRVVISKGRDKQLVYYWFVQRGRLVANEYWSKWYLFTDSLLRNRTDGALVRVTTPLVDGEPAKMADRRLEQFILAIEPRLNSYIPPDKLSSSGSLAAAK